MRVSYRVSHAVKRATRSHARLLRRILGRPEPPHRLAPEVPARPVPPITHRIRYGTIDIGLGAERPHDAVERLRSLGLTAEPHTGPPLRHNLILRDVGDDLELLLDGVHQVTLQPDDLPGSVIPVLTRLLVESDLERAHLHAGAAAIDGRTIVIPATSKTGKTHLSMALARHGRFLSDEIIGVSASDGLLTAPPRPLAVKPGGRHLVPGGAAVAPTDPDATWWLPPSEVGLAITETARPGLLVAATRRPGPVELDDLDPAAAIELLLGNTFGLRRPGPQLAALVRLAAESRLLQIAYEHADEAAVVLRTALEEHPTGPSRTDLHLLAPPDPPAAGATRPAQRPTPGVLTVLAGERAVLYEPRTRRIVRLDPAGRDAWHRLVTEAETLDPTFAEELRALGLIAED